MGTPSYEGKQVYMGLDVHREFFVASCICNGVVVKRCRMPGTAEAVMSLVSKEFGGARVRAAYEAGCSGFWLYRKLVKAGIDCIVVHAASIEVSSRDTVKTDKRDSLKIAQQLSAGRLRGVRVPTEEEGFKACHRSCGRSVSKDVYTDSCGEEGIGEELSWSG